MLSCCFFLLKSRFCCWTNKDKNWWQIVGNFCLYIIIFIINIIIHLFIVYNIFVHCLFALLSAVQFHFAHFSWHDIHNGAIHKWFGLPYTMLNSDSINCRTIFMATRTLKFHKTCQVFWLPSSFPKSFHFVRQAGKFVS